MAVKLEKHKSDEFGTFYIYRGAAGEPSFFINNSKDRYVYDICDLDDHSKVYATVEGNVTSVKNRLPFVLMQIAEDAKKSKAKEKAVEKLLNPEYKAGQRIHCLFSVKPDVETLEDLIGVEKKREYCEVQKVVKLTEEEYTDIVEDLCNPVHKAHFGTGGWTSDVKFKKGWKFKKASKDDQEKFMNSSVRLVSLIVCEGQETLAIDCQGYDYARYAGRVFINV